MSSCFSSHAGRAAALLLAFFVSLPSAVGAATNTNDGAVPGAAGPGLQAGPHAAGLTMINKNLRAIGQQLERHSGAANSGLQELGDHETDLSYYEKSQDQSRDKWRDSEELRAETQGPKTPGAAKLVTFLQTGNIMMSEGPRLAQVMFSRIADANIASLKNTKATPEYRTGLMRAALQSGCTSRAEAQLMSTIPGLGSGQPRAETEGFLTNAPGQVAAKKTVNISPGQPASRCLGIRYKLLTSIASEDLWASVRGGEINQNPDGPTHNIGQLLVQATFQPVVTQEVAGMAPHMSFNCGDVGINCEEEYGYFRTAGQNKGVNPACLNQQETPSMDCINDLTVAAVQSYSDDTCRERNVNGAQCASALAANFGTVQSIRGRQYASMQVGGSYSQMQGAAAKLYAYLDSPAFRTYLASLSPADLKRIDLATSELLERDRKIMLAALGEFREQYQSYYAQLERERRSASLAQLFRRFNLEIGNGEGVRPRANSHMAAAPFKATPLWSGSVE
jgi:hypothetical protein